MTAHYTPREPGGRRIPRPTTVKPCPDCNEPAGANYASCPGCYATIEALWMADWADLLVQEGIGAGDEDERLLAQVIASDIEAYPWTIVDIAHTLTTCAECGAEVCGGPLSCATCKIAFENLWAYDMEAGYQGNMTLNEHMIRVGRLELRHPHRYSDTIARTARWLMPIGMTNPTPVEPFKMQTIYAAFEAGTLTVDETKWDNSFAVIYAKAAK